MAELAALTTQHLGTFTLVFCRLGAILTLAPVLGHRSIPVTHRAGLAVLLALVLAPLLAPAAAADRDALGWAVAIAGEILVGLVIGFVAHMVVAAVQIAGELTGLGMGLSAASVYDPSMGGQMNVVTTFQELLALLLFLTLNGHYLVLQAAAASFQRIAPGAPVHAALAGGVVALGSKLLRAGLELAAPIVGILFVLNAVMALLARVAPQTNVFALTAPVTLGLGIFGLVETAPYFSQAFAGLVAQMTGDLNVVLREVANGLR